LGTDVTCALVQIYGSIHCEIHHTDLVDSVTRYIEVSTITVAAVYKTYLRDTCNNI
jgi:hypothetical protein